MEDSDLVAESVTRFALDLYREQGKLEGNLFFSPASIAIALSMTLSGAKGETAREMARTLNLPDIEPSRMRHSVIYFRISVTSTHNPRVMNLGIPVTRKHLTVRRW